MMFDDVAIDAKNSKNLIFLVKPLNFHMHSKKLVGINWSLLSSPSYTYIHCFSLIWCENLSKINVYEIYGSIIRFSGIDEFL